MGKNRKQSRGSRKDSKTNKELSAEALVYNGPIISAIDRAQEDLHTMLVARTIDVTTSGAGGFLSVISDDPSATSDWSSLSGSFEEYRTLGMHIKFYPQNRYSKVSVVTRPVGMIVDRNASAALASYDVVATHASAQICSMDDPFTYEARMQGSDEAEWNRTASPISHYWIKFYSDGNSFSTTYGIMFIYYRVQFRGRA